MSVINLYARRIIDSPVLNHTSLSSEQHIIFINLENLCRRCIEVQCFEIVLSLSLQVDTRNVHEGLPIVGEAQNSGGLLEHSLVPLDLDHLVLVRRDPVALVLLDHGWRVGLLLQNRIAIIVVLLILIVFVLLVVTAIPITIGLLLLLRGR